MRQHRRDEAGLPGSRSRTARGVLSAGLIIVSWIATLIGAFVLDYEWSVTGFFVIVGIVILRTFLSTGLFIVSHDAIHGTIAPTSRRVNVVIGRLAAGLYAFFPFQKLAHFHRLHHCHPGTDEDPDFQRPGRPGFFAWYLSFVRVYADWRQFVGFGVTYNLLAHLVGVEEYKLWLLWIVPTLLSTLQLFYFGTYLPHRVAAGEFRDAHRARSNAWPRWLSFLTCYHFGYHLEHHRRPDVPWWLLPSVRRAELGERNETTD